MQLHLPECKAASVYSDIRAFPGIPVIDIPVPFSPRSAAIHPPTPPPIHAHTKGCTSLKFTPNTAGSVIPSNAEIAEG